MGVLVEIVDMPIEQIKPYKKNPRKNEKAIPEVVKSLKEFGFRQPLVVDSNMVLIVGHTRLLAAKELGLAKVPVHIASTLTPAQVRAYRIADNRSHDRSEWSIPELSEELDALFEMDEKFDLDFMDFSLEDFKEKEFIPDLPNEDEDEKPEKKPILHIECKDMSDLDELFQEMNDRGYKVKI
jgi:ParB-like chromosome segregation protein Spo0J